MIEVTQAAQQQVDAYFEGKEVQSIRIFLNQGCGGPQLAMALDRKKALEAGCTREEILEAAGMAMVFGGGPVLASSATLLLDCLNTFEKK